MQFRPAIVAFVAFALLLGLAIVATPTGIAKDATPAASPTACPEGTPRAGKAATPKADATPCPEAGAEVTIAEKDIYFDPKAVTIPANTDVTVKLPNEGVTLHNFSIDKLKISVDIQPGKTEQVIINAPAGTYQYYCNVPGHKAAGMVGTLTVQ